jgi:metal-sulfur cluster biosynthetic enzyme
MEADVFEALRRIVDPEIGMNLVDLGLIYGVAIDGEHVEVKMTLTTPGCPMHEQLVRGARLAILALDGVEDATVEVVWEPPWNPDMMSPAARQRLGNR